MNDPLPPIPTGGSHNYNKKDPDEFSTAAKNWLTFLGIVYVLVVGAIAISAADSTVAFLALCFALGLPIISLFFKGYRFFALGACIAVVFGCLVPFGALIVICGRNGGH